LPFKEGEKFGNQEVTEVLEFLVDEQVLHRRGSQFFWMNDAFPAHNISLRSASQENVVIIDTTDVANVRVIGEMDRFSSMTLLHEEAIYLHQGVQYQVEKLDYEEKKAYIREVDVDYFTDANLAVSLNVLEVDKEKSGTAASIGYGDVMAVAKATIFKKIKFETHENIGSGPIHLPEEELHTSATWLEFEQNEEKAEQLEAGLIGIANVLKHVSPLFVMCDASDLHVVPQIKALHSEKPTIFIYDSYPGGIGLSEKIFNNWDTVLEESLKVIKNCPCENGCPSCTGTSDENIFAKKAAVRLLQQVRSLSPDGS
jgi:DEAD/DEAH box helicase domain-containing protein